MVQWVAKKTRSPKPDPFYHSKQKADGRMLNDEWNNNTDRIQATARRTGARKEGKGRGAEACAQEEKGDCPQNAKTHTARPAADEIPDSQSAREDHLQVGERVSKPSNKQTNKQTNNTLQYSILIIRTEFKSLFEHAIPKTRIIQPTHICLTSLPIIVRDASRRARFTLSAESIVTIAISRCLPVL